MLNYDDTLAQKIKKFYPDAYTERVDMNGPERSGGDFNVIILPEAKK